LIYKIFGALRALKIYKSLRGSLELRASAQSFGIIVLSNFLVPELPQGANGGKY
jgi:hypothetical protein